MDTSGRISDSIANDCILSHLKKIWTNVLVLRASYVLEHFPARLRLWYGNQRRDFYMTRPSFGQLFSPISTRRLSNYERQLRPLNGYYFQAWRRRRRARVCPFNFPCNISIRWDNWLFIFDRILMNTLITDRWANFHAENCCSKGEWAGNMKP